MLSSKYLSFSANEVALKTFNNAVKHHVMALALVSRICKDSKTLFSPSEHPCFSEVQVMSTVKHYLPDLTFANTDACVATVLVSL